MGVCQGPIAGIGTVWWDKNVGALSSLPAAVYVGSDGQATDPYWQTNHTAEALGYSGTATVVANNYAMGNTATLPNFSFEVHGSLSLSGTNGLDANPASIVDNGWATRVSVFPTATPIRRVPKSNASTVASGIWLT